MLSVDLTYVHDTVLYSMDSVIDVMIDEDGVFKYILIELCEKKRGGSGEQRKKLIIRGFEWAEFHGERGLLLSTFLLIFLQRIFWIECLPSSISLD